MSLFDQNSSFFHRNKGRYYGNNQETFGFAAIIKREIEPKIISSNYHSMTNTLTKPKWSTKSTISVKLFLHTTLSTLLIIAECWANVTDDPNDTEGGERLVTSGWKTCSFFAGRSKLMLTSFFSLLSRYGLIVSLRTQAHLYAVSTFVINKEHF